MRLIALLPAVAAVVVSLGFAGEPEEPWFKDKPLGRWIALTRDQSRDVRYSAAHALGQIGSEARAAVMPVVRQWLESRNVEHRVIPASVLAQMQPEDKRRAVPEVAKLLAHDSMFARRAAAEALGEMGPEAKRAVPDLTKLLEDKEPSVREAAAEALKRIREKP